VNVLDVLIVAALVAAGVGGYRLGFMARATSWAGMAIGLFLAARLLPSIIESLRDADRVRLLFTAIAVLVGGAFIGQAIGLVIGARLHLALPVGGARRVDRTFGAVAGVMGVVVAVWLLVPAAADARGWPADQTRNSVIARAFDRWFPAAPDTLQALRTIIGDTDFPRVFDALEPAPDLGPPPAASGLTAEAQEVIARSTVQVEGEACGRLQDGSGVVVGDGLVVTNAHVVAGESSTVVYRHPDGAELPATVVAFDANRDLAVLSVPDLDRPALPLADAEVGAVGAAFGHPGGGALRVAPFQIGQRITALGRDIYDSQPTERQVLVLSADLAPGDSGAGLVDPAGNVIGIAFAIAPDEPNVAYGLSVSEVEAVLATVTGGTVDAGPCIG
jgi:hypothetical protein